MKMDMRVQIHAELDRGPHMLEISGFLQRELNRLSQLPVPQTERVSSTELDRTFRECLIEVQGDRIQGAI